MPIAPALVLAAFVFVSQLAARGETPAAFDRRCIPAGGVAPRSNTPGILGRRALPAGRLAGLGATLDFHHGLLGGRIASARLSKLPLIVLGSALVTQIAATISVFTSEYQPVAYVIELAGR